MMVDQSFTDSLSRLLEKMLVLSFCNFYQPFKKWVNQSNILPIV